MDIRGWMREDERLALRRWAFGKHVLELGCFEGLSTIQLAATAASVTSVDSFDGRGTPEAPSWSQFAENMRLAGVQNHTLIQGTFAEVLPKLEERYGLVFIDGSHDYESVAEDIQLSLRVLAEGGLLAFHDFDIDHPGVRRAVGELFDRGADFVDQANSLVLVDPFPSQQAASKAQVAVVCPTSDGWCLRESAVASLYCSEKYSRTIFSRSSSLLPTNHNQLLSDALNARSDGITHMAMLHNDVAPQHNWVDVLMEEMERHRLDVISAVVPLKNGKGLTSTGVGSPGNKFAVRRLSLAELYELPVTFTVTDVPFRQDEDCGLMVNTGCFLMKINQPWVSGLYFRQYDEMVFETSTGLYKPRAISEDWDFCRQLLYRGARIGATRAVSLYHGIPEFHNHGVWGNECHDEDYLRGQDEHHQLSAADV